jgi:hypothetical protein
MTDKPAGRPGRSTEAVENERLRKENEKLTAELTRTKAALEVVGKAHALLELLSGSADGCIFLRGTSFLGMSVMQ